MALYLLNYDIAESNDDYQQMYVFLDRIGAVRILQSQWAVPWKNGSNALELLNEAAKQIVTGDRLFVCELFNHEKACAWLKLRTSDKDFQALLSKWARTFQ
jgi:hypothetical protein